MEEILISIYPHYNNLIAEGRKNFGFCSFEVKTINNIVFWIYKTTPTKAIKYRILVKPAVQDLPKGVSYGMGHENFYRNINDGKFAYEIIEFSKLDSPIALATMKEIGASAPQIFYLKTRPELINLLNH